MCIACFHYSRVCATFKHYRSDKKCWNKPPGKGTRRHCHDCVKSEFLCKAYYTDKSKRTRVFCDKYVVGIGCEECKEFDGDCGECADSLEAYLHCDGHDQYDRNCAKCIAAPVPKDRHFFCGDHCYFEKEAREKLKKNKDSQAEKQV
eukprot:28922_1